MITAINSRKSVRQYQDQPLPIDLLSKIKTIISEAKPLFKNIPMETFLIEDGQQIKSAFTGLMTKYTKVEAPHYLAFTSEIHQGHLENIGFIGEEIVLRLTQLGIGTCWLGSSIKKEVFKKIVNVQDKQNYIILIALGLPAEKLKPVTTRKRLDKNKIITGTYGSDYETIIQSLTDAPSSVNSQPWKLSIVSNKFHLYLQNKNILTKYILKDMNHIDMGIGLNNLYNCATSLGYTVEFKNTSHDEIGTALYIISAILNK